MKKELPTLKKDGFFLESGIQLHADAPTTFWIPSDKAKDNIKPGDIVKLSFAIRTINIDGREELTAERMWVVVSKREDDWFIGILDNQPTCTDEIQPGLVLEFRTEHVINIYDKEGK